MKSTILSVVLALTALLAVPAFAANHSFEITGEVIGGGNGYVVVNTGSGPGGTVYWIVCASNIDFACHSAVVAAEIGDGPTVTMTGDIILQSEGSLGQTARFRAYSMTIH